VANRQDTDGDGLTDGAEIFVHHTNPALTDTDGDGLSDWGEIHLYGTNPLGADTDGDGMPDGWEIGHGLNPLLDDGGLDGDGDGLSNHQEYLLGTNPNNADTDGDGLPDGWEVQHELNALNATGEDGADGDPDGDGFSNLQEFLMQGEPRHPGLSPEQLVFHFMHCRGSSSLRVDVEDSHVCGGMNNVRQEVTDIYHVPPLLRCSAYLLRVTVKGAVEDHQENFDIVSLKTDPFFCALREETEYFRGNDNGNECEMATKTETKDIWFHNRGTVTLMYDTVDALFHSNAYAEVTAASFVKKAPYPDHFFKLDLDVDTDRNHAVHDVLDEEGEDGWTLSRGALVSPRIRIDPYGTNPVQGLAKLVIQRPDPLLNETPSKSMRIRLPDSNTRQYLWMVDAGGTNINFDSSGCYTLPLWPSNGATFYAASSYSRKYNDGLPVRFDIELELLISNQVVCSDNVRLTVAPLILPPECYPAEKVYSLCFELSGITMLNTTATSAFIQDMVKFTKCQIHSNATHTVAVPLDHSRAGNLDAVLRVDEKIPSLAIWPFLGDGGNIMATPPLGPHAPYGKIMLGTKNQLSAPQWARQGLQPEILTVDTSWLLVGHVDEIVMFTATNKMLVADPWKAADLLHEEIVSGCDTQTLWWGTASNHVGAARTTTVAKVVIATNAAGQFKRSHLPTGGLPDSSAPVTIVFSNAVFATGDYLRVNHEILSVLSVNGPVTQVARAQGDRPSQAHAEDDVIYALSDAMRLNLPLGDNAHASPASQIALFTNELRVALGDAIEFVPMPVLFDWVEQGDDNGFLAATPNLVNSLVMNESRVIMPAPGIARFKNYAEEHVLGAEFYDSWVLHVNAGNLHCGTAAIRSLPAVPPFWEQVESWE
jgi:hypothetical protein